MIEKINEKTELGESVNIEQQKEAKGGVLKFEQQKEAEEDKEEVRRRVYDKGIDLGKKEIAKTAVEEKTVSKFIKKFYSVGVKAIEEAKKVLRPDELDNLHDNITNKNKGDKDINH